MSPDFVTSFLQSCALNREAVPTLKVFSSWRSPKKLSGWWDLNPLSPEYKVDALITESSTHVKGYVFASRKYNNNWDSTKKCVFNFFYITKIYEALHQCNLWKHAFCIYECCLREKLQESFYFISTNVFRKNLFVPFVYQLMSGFYTIWNISCSSSKSP